MRVRRMAGNGWSRWSRTEGKKKESTDNDRYGKAALGRMLTSTEKERIRRRLIKELAAQKKMLERQLRLLEEHDGFAETEDRDLA